MLYELNKRIWQALKYFTTSPLLGEEEKLINYVFISPP